MTQSPDPAILKRPTAGPRTQLKADTSSREPVGAEPERQPSDTTTPIPTDIQPFREINIPEYREFLIQRASKVWPHINERNINGLLIGFIRSNEFLFLHTGKAVFLGQAIFETFYPRPIVKCLFSWKLAGTERGGDRDIIAMFRSCEAWGASMAARRILMGDQVDFDLHALKDRLGYEVKGFAYKDY